MSKVSDDVLKNIETVVLNRVKVGTMSVVSPAVLEQLTVRAEYDVMADHIKVAMLTYLYAGKEHVQHRSAVAVPLTWWDHLKQRFFPAWALVRWPAQMRHIDTLTLHQHVCPHLNLPFCSDQSHIEFLQTPGCGSPLQEDLE